MYCSAHQAINNKLGHLINTTITGVMVLCGNVDNWPAVNVSVSENSGFVSILLFKLFVIF